jgi:DNA-binding NarL/FixJ family response regulator
LPTAEGAQPIELFLNPLLFFCIAMQHTNTLLTGHCDVIQSSFHSAEASRIAKMPARILIADDHELMRRGLRTIIESHKGWQVCGEARTGNEAVKIAEAQRPQIAILDITMPELNGLDAAKKIHRVSPKTEILILSLHCTDDLVREVIDAGARGYLTKIDSDSQLEKAIGALLEHRPFFSTRVAEVLMDRTTTEGRNRKASLRRRLTLREREIVQLIAEGKNTKEVATHLGISTKTADTHRSNIMRKLEIHSVTELVRFAVRSLIIEA